MFLTTSDTLLKGLKELNAGVIISRKVTVKHVDEVQLVWDGAQQQQQSPAPRLLRLISGIMKVE